MNVEQLAAHAKHSLPAAHFAYFATGSEEEQTLTANPRAWRRLALRPHVLRDVSKAQTSTTVQGTPIDLPAMIAPTAYHRVAHPDGELATARGAASAGTVMTVSTFATTSLEEIAEQGARLWFQLSIHRDRGFTRELVQRAEAAGYLAICVTVDVPVRGRRASSAAEEFVLPEGLTMANLTAMTSRLGVTNREYSATALDPNVTPEHISWLAENTTLPVVVKGVLRGDDAVTAVRAGARGVVVSNHGGRQLDGAIPTAYALPEVAQAVGSEVEVYADGGIRRGSDVVKALALGARAVLIGRPIVWSLVADGAAGVAALLTHLKQETRRTLALCGASDPAQIDPSIIDGDHPFWASASIHDQ